MSLYYKYFKIHLQSIMQYKISFLFTTIGQLLVSFNVFLGVYFMFQRFHTLKGYSFSEVLLCFSIVIMQFTIAECYARGFDTFSTIISNGEFDRMMVRPRSVILQILGSRIEFTKVSRLVQAFIMLIYSIKTSEIIWTPNKILCIILMIICGSLLFSGIFLLYAALCFFTTEGLEIINILTNGLVEHGKYPIGIYGKRILQFFTYIVPFALTGYYPLLYLLGRNNHSYYTYYPLLGSLFIIPCYILWRIGIRHYKSTGS